MVKEITQLLVTFGIIGGIALAPTSFTKPSEPDLELPVVGTYENLKKLVEESSESNYRGGIQFGVVTDLAMNAVAIPETTLLTPETILPIAPPTPLIRKSTIFWMES